MPPLLPVLDKLVLLPQSPLRRLAAAPPAATMPPTAPPHHHHHNRLLRPHSRLQKSRRQLRLYNEASAFCFLSFIYDP